MKKRIIAMLLAATLMFSIFAGCGPKEEATSDTGSPVTDTTDPATNATPDKASSDPITLELYLQKTNVVDQFSEIISKFEAANPDIKIELTSVPDPETALVSRIAAKDYPDIITIWPAEMFYRDLMRDGALMDISDQKFLNSIASDSRDIAKYDGKDYALSMTMSAYGIIMNNDIFAAHDLKAPNTWSELIDVCDKLQSAGIQPFSFYGKSTEQVGQLGERLIGVVDNDITSSIQKVAVGEATWDELSQVKDTANALVQLHQYGQKDILGSDYDNAFNEMATGKAAMIVYGSWGVNTLLNLNPDLNIQMIPLPNPTGGETNVAVSIDTALSISETCKNKEAALKFLEFMASPETAQWYADNEKNPPLINGVTYNVAPLQAIQSVMMDGHIFFTPSVYWPAGFRTTWEAPIQALIDPTGDHNVEQFVKSTTDICVEYFNK